MIGWRPQFAGITAMLGLAGIAYVGVELWRSWDAIVASGTHRSPMLLAVLAAAYAIVTTFLALGWTTLLQRLGRHPVSRRETLFAYGVANIAKYIPSNLFHLAVRQVFAKRFGWEQTSAAAATAIELLFVALMPLLICAVIALSTGMVPLIADYWHTIAVIGVTLGLAIVALLGLGIISRYSKWSAELWDRARSIDAWTIFRVAVLYGLFFAGTAFIAGILSLDVLQFRKHDMVLPAGAIAYLVGFSIGFLAPGTPAGLGLREAVITVLLSALATSGEAALIALLLRVVTLSGDLIFLAGVSLFHWQHQDMSN